MGAINWGEILNQGFGILQKELGKNSPPPPPSDASGGADSFGSGSFPSWVWPLVIVGAVLLFGKKLFK